MEIQLITFILAGCVFAISAGPANRRQDIQHLVSLFKNIRDLRHAISPSIIQETDNNDKVSYIPELPDSPLMEAGEDVEPLKKGFLRKPAGTLNKRQGAWSYDYGLGGGRFGKRNYGDYGIGGGRFGRDVDHVDLSDTNDSELPS